MKRLVQFAIIPFLLCLFVASCSNVQNFVATANLSGKEKTRYNNMLVIDQKSLPLSSYKHLGTARGKSCKPGLKSIATASEKEAKRNLKISAARKGGNAITNLTCTRRQGQENDCYTSILCKGEVVRITSREVLQQIRQSQATASDEQQDSQKYGVGWLAPCGVVVTNFHLIKNHKNTYLGLPSGKRVEARVAGKDPMNNIAILTPEESLSGYEPLPLADSMPSAGQEVYTLGFAASSSDAKQTPAPIKGSINSTYGIKGDPRVYTIKSLLEKGYSGSPLLNMQDEVVGIVLTRGTAQELFTGQEELPGNRHYAIKTAYIRPMLNSYRANQPQGAKKGSKLQQGKSKAPGNYTERRKGVFTIIAK